MSLIGKTITGIRKMTKKEIERNDWYTNEDHYVYKCDDGTEFYALRDYEGNGPGVIECKDPNGDYYIEEIKSK